MGSEQKLVGFCRLRPTFEIVLLPIGQFFNFPPEAIVAKDQRMEIL